MMSGIKKDRMGKKRDRDGERDRVEYEFPWCVIYGNAMQCNATQYEFE